jgi:hypothetical protein
MTDINKVFWNSSIKEIKRGYIYDNNSGQYICLVCGKSFTKGVIYPGKDMLFEAEKAAEAHITDEHSSMFEYLLGLNKKLTGLTDLQRSLLGYFYKGYSDDEIVKELDGGSTSTIRNHRFVLRQREKQAKIFLSIMEILKENTPVKKNSEFVDMHKTATSIDDRYAITEEENEKLLKIYFPEGPDGPLGELPVREKRKIVILKNLIKRFDAEKEYTEKEVNEILKNVYHDYVTLRRYLIEYGFMDRVKDGSSYWVKI